MIKFIQFQVWFLGLMLVNLSASGQEESFYAPAAVSPIQFTYVPAPTQVECSSFDGIPMATAASTCDNVTVTYEDVTSPYMIAGGPCGQFTTFSVGGWGAPNGTAANYRDANFASAFPNGLVVGCGGNNFIFTSAQAIENFLPAGGTSESISGSLTNPTDVSNQLASQLVAATLSLGFDLYDQNFASSNGFLGDITYNSGVFQGMTVSEVVFYANQALGGCTQPYGLTELADALAVLNLNYDGVNVDNGNFSCNTESLCGTLTVRTWTASDACGNSITSETRVFMIDNLAPVFDQQVEDITVNCGNAVPAFLDLTASGGCSNATVTRTESVIETSACLQVIEVSYLAVDDCGNQASTSYLITINDTEAPQLNSTIENVTISCTDEIPAAPSVTFTDNCDNEVEVLFNESSFNNGCEQIIVRAWTATDACGNQSVATQTINIVDNVAPVVDAYFPYVQLNCGETDGFIGISATDNCNDVVITYTDQINSGGCYGTIERTYRVEDACGNFTTAVMYISVIDNEGPIINNPADATFECTEAPTEMPLVEIYDACGYPVELLSATQEIIETDACTYQIVWTWVAMDYCENYTTATTTITVTDFTAPVVLEQYVDASFSCEDAYTVPFAPTAIDNCDQSLEVASDVQFIAGECVNEYTLIYTWTYTDNCNNSTTSTVTHSFYDNTVPVFTSVAESVTIECDQEVPSAFAAATDNCEGSVNITYTEEIVEGNCANSYSIVRTYIADDVCGNSASAVQIIDVVDTTAPVITGTIEIDLPCDNYEGVYVSATDDCSENIVIGYTDMMVSGGCQGRLIRTYTATDACGNTSEFAQIITLIDTTAPIVVSQPENAIIECGTAYDAPVVVWSDNCDEELETSVSVSEEGTCTQTVTYTFTAEDNCGNVATTTVVYTIVDTTGPVFIEVPADITVECSDEIPAVVMPVAIDNCDQNVVVSHTDMTQSGDCTNEYTIIRMFRAFDDCGNQSMAVQYINIVDNTAPTFNEYVSSYTVECSDELPVYELSATDNCEGEVTISGVENIIEGNCANNYTIVRTYTATDACGNASEAVITINVVDTTAPVISGIIEIDRPCDDYMGIFVEASDNCAENVSIDYVDEMVSGGCQGRVIRVYTATDACGNSSEFTQIITLTDETLPVVVEQSENATIECGTEYSVPFVQWSDNCDDELVTNMTMVSEGTCPEVITYTFTAEDNCGNVATATVVYTIVDTTAPMWNGESYTIDADCSDIVEFSAPMAYDMCSEATVESSMVTIEGTCPAIYTEVYTYVATDDCGNVSEPFVITVNYTDTTAPMWETIPSSNEYSCDQQFEFVMPTATDNCSEFEITFEQNILEGECANNYTIERIYTATDACGNVSETVSVYYYIYDNQAPVFETELSDLNFDCPVDIVPAEVVVTDNCSEVTVTSDVETIYSDECGNGYFRVFYLAVDACGNASETEYYVNIYDETAPVLSETPGDLVLDCEASLPEAPVVTATDNCGGEIEVMFEETIIGDMPAEGSIADCNLITPVRPDGNPCNYNYDWAMALFAMPTAHRYYQVVEGSLVQYEDRIEVTAQLGNAQNPANGFYVTVTFTNPLTWAEWSSQAFPTGFKADCGGVDANHPDWIYYLLEAGEGAELVGYGAYAGSAINLVHAPANNYFGFQLGNGANNYNAAENGFGGWFTYNGVFLVNGEPIMSGNAAGAGDFAFELDCCPDYSVVRTWTAMDCTGNYVTHTQTISWAGSSTTENNGGDAAEEAAQEAPANLDIIALFPNPSINSSDVQITSKINSNVMLDVVDVTGRTVAKLFDGRVEAGQVYKFTLNTSALNNGLYQVRLISNNEVSTKQLQVVK